MDVKKYIVILFTGLLVAGFMISPLYASEDIKQYGKIENYEDIVSQKEENALIHSRITATTDENGLIAFPFLKDSKLLELKIIKGTLEKDVEKVKNGSLTYYVADFKEAKTTVEFELNVEQADIYELQEAKQKGTFPGGVHMVKYKMKNTAPVNIEKYTVKMATKENYELYEIVDYDPEEEFDIVGIDGVKYGTTLVGEVKSGETASIALNLNQTNAMMPYIMWGVAAIVSAFFLYKNKDILEKAKVASKAKKEGKKHA